MQPNTVKAISTFLKVLAILTFIGGVILGIILGRNLKGDFDFATAFVYWARGLIYGMIVLAISAIIDLLLQIRDKVFDKCSDAATRVNDRKSSADNATLHVAHMSNRKGKCEECGKEEVGLYYAKIVDEFGTRYMSICKDCASAPGCTIFD